jgi:predicted outer membrane repeat protein
MHRHQTPLLRLGLVAALGGCNSGAEGDSNSETAAASATSTSVTSDASTQGSTMSAGTTAAASSEGSSSDADTTSAGESSSSGASASDSDASSEASTTAVDTADTTTAGDSSGATTEGGTTGDATGDATGDDTGDDTGDLPDFVAECDDDPANPVIVTVMPNVTARFPSITAGLAAASDGSVIEVCPGTYSDKIEVKHDITLRGAGADKTIIDGGGFHFNLGDGEAVVEGFGFTHCNAKIPSGWNIASSGAISVSDTYGAQETLTVRDCRFFENSAEYGAAIHVSGSNNGGKNPDIIIEGSVFEKNVATGEGGAIASYGRVHISDSVFVANKARTGGALALSYGCTGPSVCDITHTVIMKNHTTGNSKYEGGGGIFIDSCGVNCLGGLTVTDSDLGFGASEENTDHQGLPEDVLINDGTDPWSRYGWYYNNVSFVCSQGSCTMP